MSAPARTTACDRGWTICFGPSELGAAFRPTPRASFAMCCSPLPSLAAGKTSDPTCQLGGHLPFLIDCKKIMRQLGRDQTAVPEIQLNRELKCRYADRPTAERGPYSRGDFRAKPLFKRPESSKNLLKSDFLRAPEIHFRDEFARDSPLQR